MMKKEPPLKNLATNATSNDSEHLLNTANVNNGNNNSNNYSQNIGYNSTISALVRGIHETGIHDLHTLHLPLMTNTDDATNVENTVTNSNDPVAIHTPQRQQFPLTNRVSSYSTPNSVLSTPRSKFSISPQPSATSLTIPRFIINIEPPETPNAEDDCNKTITGSEVPHSPGRRFSQLNFALRRFSHAHSSGNLNRYGDSMGSLGHRALLQYVDSNDISALRAILDSRHVPVDDRDENGTTVLMVVAGRGLTAFVREFLARGAEVQAEDNDNWTALLCAAKGGHLDIVQLLVDHGADIEHREMGGWTALMWASYRGHTELVRFLLEKGADVNSHGNYHLGPLLWAAGRGFKEIVELLVQRGAKINVGDKYGTTALVWACRKGNVEIVDTLLKAGANVDTAGMYSWTPLLVATTGGHTDCVTSLLEKRPNVNALDKDGMTALSIASREGFQEIAAALIAAGAYINIQDRAGDTPLIHAVKGGHRGLVEALLKKHADVDIQGKDRKTAMYTAVEKGHSHIVKILLPTNPDLEASTKDGDTALLRAVRNRNLDNVQMLLDRKAKVTASDKRGDTCLHIAMRARSKAIVEALLRNPKNSQLLYRANKSGETPYGIDTNHQKTILGQVFGARRLNTNEDSEGMLGYELYSSALADVLSEPTLTTPITVGLYAKWGSGKSFLLSKLREEMNNFARQWAEPPIRTSGLLFLVCLHIALILATIVGLSVQSVMWGSIAGVIFLVLTYLVLAGIRYANYEMDLYWAYSVHHGIEKRLGRLRLILQVAFCHPPGPQAEPQAKPVRFHFAEAGSASPTGEGSVAQMLTSLFETLEFHYGWLSTRLYRAFRPKVLKSSAGWRWRRMCCVPIVIIFELGLLTLIAGISLVTAYFTFATADEQQHILVSIYVICAVLVTIICTNLHVLAKAFGSLFVSQGRHLKQAVRGNEGAPLTALGAEVALMTDMVKCLDAFTNQQSRLVGVVDALDSCDTERILSMLNAIQTLLSSPNRPFVLLIAVDPHVIAKAAEANSRRLFTEGGIGGHDFLRNLVHLPVYLQNSGLRKVQRAQMTALLFKRNYSEFPNEDGPTLGHSVSARRLSNASEIMSSQEKLRTPHNAARTAGKKLRLSESVASSIGSNLHRLGQNPQGVLDLSKIMLTDDYFSDVNPRSIRRLMNVIYITVRLLKAFQIDFSWYRLSSWINLTEQWPLRASMIVLQHDQSMDSYDDNMSLQSVYEKVRIKIACLREAAPLLELDRDERKLDAFLQLHKSDLLVADLRIFLPFTINLDPYLRKVLKEDQQNIEDEGPIMIQTKPNLLPPVRIPTTPSTYMTSPAGYPPYHMFSNDYTFNELRQRSIGASLEPQTTPLLSSPNESFSEDILQTRLSDLTVEGVISLVERVEDLRPALLKLAPILKENSITGRVLKYCDLSELKTVLGLSFGHWELFRLLVTTLRDCEKVQRKFKPTPAIADVPANPIINKDSTDSHNLIPNTQHSRKNSTSHMEKQVTLEEQMICGALQTLNEEAFEDVASSERPSPSGMPTGEMLAAAAQLHLAPIRESSEFGSPSDEQKTNNILQYASNNNYNNINTQKHLNTDYNRSASTNSLQSLTGGLYLSNADSELYGNSNVLSSTLNPTTLVTSSPEPMRRDSILKPQGSMKTSDKRVSIKQTTSDITIPNNNNKIIANVEYISEISLVNNTTGPKPIAVERRLNKPPSGPRPASLVITKNDKKSGQYRYKMTRSSSVDYEDIEGQHQTNNANKLTSEQMQEDESAPLVFTVHK
ncbi:kinase D-interacting substrate of 220 kDa B-like isoform X3 [Teleopsis dalmanni]|uniref:kinase D-interacting substrate of 220 kDa B-like isoform X3 n=1 Tax=Teleopsis dalmanni TaxID=139649 RepID=UPI0018CCD97E|nr:kinase D-interacting substrate of 220 kDa B-like isoform X3 [Teleopsis dalmanni]